MSVSRGTRAANDPPDVVIGSELERLRRNWRVIAVIAAAALGVLALQAFLHGHFSAVDEYDDGVYFGASLELSHGVLAYRDFAFIQPPMITVWMLPFAGLSSLTGTAVAMEAGRFFVDLVSVTNVVLVGALVRRRSTLHVIVVTGITAFSQGTIRSSQTILIEPFLVLACLTALLFLMHGDAVTLSSRRVGWSGACFGVAGATKVWAIFPLVAALIIMSTVKKGGRRTLVGGALIGFFACSLPFIVGAPVAFFHEVLVTQATRNAGGLALPERMADLTGIPGFSSLTEQHRVLGLGLLALLLLIGSLALLVCRNVRERLRWSPLERFSLWSTLLVGAALLLSPTYYYHYSGFMAPFLALVVGTVIAKLRDPLGNLLPVRSLLLRAMVELVTVPSLVALLLATVIAEVLHLPVAPHVGDSVSDAIPARGCVLYANPTLAILDNRFTADTSGCPDVIDWLGQERVLDNGVSVTGSGSANKKLQTVMSHWLDASDAIVLEAGNFGLNAANVGYLSHHFERRAGIPRGLRIYVRASRHRQGRDAEGPLAIDSRSSHDRGG